MNPLDDVQFDTHHAIRRLTATGMSEPTAEAVVETIHNTQTHSYKNLATKQELHAVELATKHELHTVKNEVMGEIKRLEQKMEVLEHKLTVRMGTMLGTAVTILAGIQAAFKFLG